MLCKEAKLKQAVSFAPFLSSFQRFPGAQIFMNVKPTPAILRRWRGSRTGKNSVTMLGCTKTQLVKRAQRNRVLREQTRGETLLMQGRVGTSRLHVQQNNDELRSWKCQLAMQTVYIHYTISRFFFKENVRYPVWTCSDPICLILGTRFTMILGTDFQF